MTTGTIVAAFSAVLLMFIGVFAVIRPEVLQSWAIARYRNRWKLLIKFVESPDCIWDLRVSGVGALIMSAIIIRGLFWG